MLSVLCTGTLVRDPQERKSAVSKSYATALVRVPTEDSDAMLVSVIAFASSSVAGLLVLAKGDACSIAGRARLSSWGERW